MTTAARPTSEQSCHWYAKDGTPVYEVARATGEGMRPTTLADARKLGLFPSVTTILGILRKPELETWLQEQLCLAVLTTPRVADEQIDAFVHRVIHVDKVHKQESQKAMDRGTEIHNSLEGWALGCPIVESLRPWVNPVAEFLSEFGTVEFAEKIVSGYGYAGKTDLIQLTADGNRHIWDFKTTKKLPREAYREHVLQCSAYAAASSHSIPITTGNIYISTIDPGKFVACIHEESWSRSFTQGFEPLLRHWQWANNYRP